MDHSERLPGVSRRHRLILTSIIGGLVLLLAVAALVRFRPGEIQSDQDYLNRQIAALQPDYHSDLEKLALAPRYTISATVDPVTGNVAGEVTLQYTNTSQESLSELVFRLYPNAGTIYGGGSLDVTKITQGEASLQYELFEESSSLSVFLPQPLEPSQSTSLNLVFTAQVPEGAGHGYGIYSRGNGILSLAGWYPILAVYDQGWQAPPVPAVGDALFAETSLYEVNLTLPAGYDLISTGTLVMTDTVAAGTVTGSQYIALAATQSVTAARSPTTDSAMQDQITWRLVSGPVREFAVAIVEGLETYETQVAGITLRLHASPAGEPRTSIDGALQILSTSFESYLDRFGPYPFTEFDLVEAPISIGGYEFSGMVYVDQGVRQRGSPLDYEYLVAHEVAHQWWYGLVGNHTVKEPWLDEGHATYGPVIFRQHAGEPDAGERLVANWIQDAGMRQPNDPPVNSSALEYNNWSPYRDTVYIHGALFLHELHKKMGDEKFFELLRHFQETYRYQITTTRDYLRMAEEMSGPDLNPLFEKWFNVGRSGDITYTSPIQSSLPLASFETINHGQ